MNLLPLDRSAPRRRPFRAAAGLVALLSLFFLCYLAGRAGAGDGGVPSGVPFFYSGTAEVDGVPIDGTAKVQFYLAPDPDNDTQLCNLLVDMQPFSKGRFRLQLPDACVAVLRTHQTLFAILVINNVKLPGTQIGGVPFANSVTTPPACHLVNATSASTLSTVMCSPGEIVTGGSCNVASGATVPATPSLGAPGTYICTASGGMVTASAICCQF